MKEENKMLSIIPLVDAVVFPGITIPLFIGRVSSMSAVKKAFEEKTQLIFILQKNALDTVITKENIYSIGTTANIKSITKMPDGALKIMTEGISRVFIHEVEQGDANNPSKASFQKLERNNKELKEGNEDNFIHIINEKYIELLKTKNAFNKSDPNIMNVQRIKDLDYLIYATTIHTNLSVLEKQKTLEIKDNQNLLEKILKTLTNETEILKLEQLIEERVKEQMDKNQKEYYLHEKIKVINKELQGNEGEYEILMQRIEKAKMSEEAYKKAISELNKLKQMPSISSEATVVRTYIEHLIEMPWNKSSKLKSSIQNAEKVLNEDHYGLNEVKERILEFLAVQKRVKKNRGPVLCLVGPPGVGKTSLGESIAKATERTFIRIALGGVRDENEIRGHRRTYIGAMPGKIIQKIAKYRVNNPLILLDEIDKLGRDMRGDPASALLEVLDPEQNSKFSDHYLEVDFDLSNILFLCTANSFDIPDALRDRMEIIRLPGYTEQEKLNIAKKYLVPKQIERNGINQNSIAIEEDSLIDIIQHYTREAGVRNLEREISKICRKIVRENLKKIPDKLKITQENNKHYLGIPKFRHGEIEEEDKIGQVTGLAWTSVGGEILTIEVASIHGKGKLIRTGSLGDVMLESIQAAQTVVRSKSKELKLENDFYEKIDLHIHVPEGATPKDGPSAGIAITTAIISALQKRTVKKDVAMTGEITLHGKVLAIGGLKEKILAAHRAGVKIVIIPFENEKDLEEIPQDIKDNLKIYPVQGIDEVLKIALN